MTICHNYHEPLRFQVGINAHFLTKESLACRTELTFQNLFYNKMWTKKPTLIWYWMRYSITKEQNSASAWWRLMHTAISPDIFEMFIGGNSRETWFWYTYIFLILLTIIRTYLSMTLHWCFLTWSEGVDSAPMEPTFHVLSRLTRCTKSLG